MCGRVCVLAYVAMLFLVSRYVMCAAMCGPAPEDGGVVRVTADYMYKSEFKARAELSSESELVLEVELPPTAPMNGAKIEIKIQAIGFAIVLLRSAAHSTDVFVSSFSAYPHISRPIRLVLSPVAELLQTRYSATHASQTRLFLMKQNGRPPLVW
jgi:hypothetical protein